MFKSFRTSLHIKQYQTADYIFIIIILAIAAGVAYLKLNSLFAWRYTSDLFTYDQILQETLAGNFGLEFTFGNGFGDRAYTCLFLMLPLKMILGEQMVVFLSLLGPITYFVTVIILYFFCKSLVDSISAFIYATIFALTLGLTFLGLYEVSFGFHPDILSGFMAVIFTLFLIQHEKLCADNHQSTFQLIVFVVCYALFMSLKDEMALLGLLYFIIIFIAKRHRFHLFFLITSLIIFTLDLILIGLSRTPFNMRNVDLIDSFVDVFNREGIGLFFHHPVITDNSLARYWGAILFFTIIMVIAIVLLKKLNVYAIALFVVGLAKMGSSFLTSDFSLITWHNFPGLVFMTGAIVVQLTEKGRKNNRYLRLFVNSIFISSIILFIGLTAPFFIKVNRANIDNAKLIVNAQEDLAEIKKAIDPKKVVSIPPYTAIEWVDGFRYAFYPRGIIWSPAGIADYVVLPTSVIKSTFNTFIARDEKKAVSTLEEEFLVIMENDHFLLLKRIKPSEKYKKDRETFIKLFGKEALGL